MGIALHFLRTALSIIRIIFHFKEHLYFAVHILQKSLFSTVDCSQTYLYIFSILLRIKRFSKDDNRPPHAPKLYDETFQKEV